MIDEDNKYLAGPQNRVIRYYFYLSNGLAILNEFRNLFLGIFAVYFTLKITSIPLLIAMFIISVIILTVVGYYVIHHVSKVREWLQIKFGTHYGVRSFDYQKGTYELLKEIKDKLN